MPVSRIPMGPVKMVNRDGVLVKFVPRGPVTESGSASGWYTRSYAVNPFTRSTGSISGIRRAQVEEAIADGDAKPHPQGGDVGVTFLHQSGLWQPVYEKKAHAEDGAQVVVENAIKEKKSRFKADMIALAEELCERLEQDAVLLHFSENGMDKEFLTVFTEE